MIPSQAKETVSISCDIKHETAKAILISTHDTEGEQVKVWIPLSQVEQIHRSGCTDGLYADKIVMSKWIASTKELI